MRQYAEQADRRDDVMQPRSAAELGPEFPYTLRTMCCIEVGPDGVITWGGGKAAYERALRGQSRLYAVWPGTWASHLFLIDDLDEFGRAFGFVRDEDRTGLADHQHDVSWNPGPHDPNPGGAWVDVDVQLNCGCEIRISRRSPLRFVSRRAGSSRPVQVGDPADRRTALERTH